MQTTDHLAQAAPPVAAPPPATGVLAAVGRRCARRPLVVVLIWVAVLVAASAASLAWGGEFSDEVELPDTQGHTGAVLLAAHEPAAGGSSGLVVFHVPRGSLRESSAVVARSVAALERLPHVLSASDPTATAGGAGGTGNAGTGNAGTGNAGTGNGTTSAQREARQRTAVSTVHFDVRPRVLGKGYVRQLDDAVRVAREGGVQVEYGGALDALTRPSPADLVSELFGFGVALVVLLLGFGSVAGAVLPLLTAVAAVVVGLEVLTLAAGASSFGTSAPTLAVMIGLGVGIDYALFLTTRFRQHVMDGADPVAAAASTAATSGRSVVVAAATVAVALLGLYASGITFVGQLGLAAVITVTTAAAGALTLVPALLGLLGRRIDRLAVRRPVAESRVAPEGAAGPVRGWWPRYARHVAHHPWRYLVAGLVLLGVLTVPLFSVRLGHVADSADPESFTDRRAYDLIAQAYGPGANAQLTVVVDLAGTTGTAPARLGAGLREAVAAVPGVSAVSAFRPSADGALLVGAVTPAAGPQDESTTRLVHELVRTTLPATLRGSGATGYVTGNTAVQVDFRDRLVSRLPVIIGVVVLTAFLLVLAAFRGLLLAVTAALLNLVSIGAAYGVVVAVFQWQWGSRWLGLDESVPLESYLPMMMFAIVFGLSMDYEVFLLSRVREAYLGTGDTRSAVASGLASTAQVITCAALIMISVFGAFAVSQVVVIKMLAVGLAASVLVDASIVRLLLVPSTMALLGPANWWMPRWLDRVLPHVEPRPAPAVSRSRSAGGGSSPRPRS